MEAFNCTSSSSFELSVLLTVFLLSQTLHVHFDSALETRFCHISQGDVVLALWGVTCGIFDILLQTALLTVVNMLLVVLCATYLLQFVLVDHAQFKLVKSLPKDAFS